MVHSTKLGGVQDILMEELIQQIMDSATMSMLSYMLFDCEND